jgi:hypothetical protein
MNIRQLNDFPIIDLLEREGIFPVRKRGNEWWYISPIRSREITASFKVDIFLNRWYDHGIGLGGKLFDLAKRLYNRIDPRDTIKILERHFSSYSAANSIIRPTGPNAPKTEAARKPAIVVKRTEILGSNLAIANYVKSRGINIEMARNFCVDAYFEIHDKEYFAVGFKNRSGGYELRNSFFKGSSSPKDITVINNQKESIAVLEGFFDFLTLLTINRKLAKEIDFMILNSNSNLSKALPILMKYREVNLYLNNDLSGTKTRDTIQQSGITAVDRSGLYKEFNDLNDYLLGKVMEKQAMYSKRNSHRNRI